MHDRSTTPMAEEAAAWRESHRPAAEVTVLRDAPPAWPSTAYRGAAAHDYDECRFTTPQGRLFAELESRQLKHATEHLTPGARVLEVGCGTGRFSEELARRDFAVVATDPSTDMIDLAARKCSGLRNVSFQQGEGADLDFAEAAFDFVFAIRVTNQTASEAYALTMIREMIRVTRPGGRVLVEFVNRRRPLPTRSRDVRLSFARISHLARDAGCEVIGRHGVLVFSQSVLNRVPDALVPVWGRLERLAAAVFWGWASRGYIVLRKR